MYINKEAHQKAAAADDPRITRIGHFLRRSGLDELPQFLNVLCGHMSIIGPRPHMHADCTAFAALLPGYKLRTITRPGITGLAQCRGFRGPLANQKDLEQRFYLDAWYIRNRSFQLDIKIFWETVWAVVRNIHEASRHPNKSVERSDTDLHSLAYATPMSA